MGNSCCSFKLKTKNSTKLNTKVNNNANKKLIEKKGKKYYKKEPIYNNKYKYLLPTIELKKKRILS